MKSTPFANSAAFLLLSLTVCVLSPVSFAAPKDGKRDDDPFIQTIHKLRESRSRIKSYDLTVIGDVDYKRERIALTDGSVREVDKVPVSFVMRMFFDRAQSKFVVARKNTARDKASGDVETSQWQIFGRRLEPVRDGEQWHTEYGKYLGSSPTFFDPLGLGIAFGGEFLRGDPWENIVENYLDWRTMKHADLGNGQLKFHNADVSITIDSARDYWPLSTSLGDGLDYRFKTEISLATVHGVWLPASAVIALPQETSKLRFIWHSVNQPIPAEWFTQTGIESRLSDRNLSSRQKQ